MKLVCHNLSKVYGEGKSETQAISDINFEAHDREFLCILGPSGCGKTTLLKIIAGLINPTSGEVLYIGERDSGPLNSMVFQEHGIFPWMNVIDNVAFGLEMRMIPRKERYEKSLEFLKKVGLSNYTKRYPHELSVGMRQRIALARAFVNNPEILLMDEPFGSLDAQTRLILQGELLKIWKENQKSVIFVTHDIEEAILLGDRILVMTNIPGKIKEVMPVHLPRPRDLKVVGSKEFGELRLKIWSIIKDEVQKRMRMENENTTN